MSNSTKQIKLGALLSYFAIGFNIVAGVLYTPWMIQQIGKSEYGLYILVTSFLTYFVMDFGLGQTIARYIAKYRVENNIEKINQLLGLTTRFYIIISGVIFVILLILFFFIENLFVQLNSSEINKFKNVYLIAGGFSLISFPFLTLDGVLIAFERFVFLKFCEMISKVGIIVLMIIGLYFGYKLYALVAINAVVGLFLIFLKLYYLKKYTPLKVDIKYKDKSLLKELIKFSFWVFVIGIAQRLLINIAPSILGAFSGTTQIALFSIGIIIEGYTWTFAHALNGLFMAKVTHLDTKENNLHEITNLMIKIGRIQLFIMGLLLIGIVVFGKDFIMLWMGKDFINSYFVAVLLIAPGFITLTQEIAYTYLFVVNELRYRAILFVGASIVSVLISIFLAPNYGAVGCAIGIFVATFLCHILGMNYVYWKIIKLEIPRFFKECYLSMILPITLSVVFGLILNYYFDFGLFHFILKTVLMSFFYVILMWFLGLNDQEKNMLQAFKNKLFLKIFAR